MTHASSSASARRGKGFRPPKARDSAGKEFVGLEDFLGVCIVLYCTYNTLHSGYTIHTRRLLRQS